MKSKLIDLIFNFEIKRIFFYLLIISNISIYASVSHQSGYYPLDSLLFKVDWTVQDNQKILISVNGFTEATFVDYDTTGVWLYNRNYVANTWEDQRFSKGCKYMPIDTSQVRGALKKVNVVRVRLVEEPTNNIVLDSIYFIGIEGNLNTKFPHLHPIVHLFVDSLDAYGPKGFYGPGDGIIDTCFDENNVPYECMIWNYELDGYGKKANIQILNPKSNFRVNQNVEIRVAGQSSVCLMNKAVSVKASNADWIGGKKRIETDIYNNFPTKYKWLKFRSGASAQSNAFGKHEIGIKLLEGLKIGEVPVTPVITYINGSYHSLAFSQDKPNQYAVERYWGTDNDDVNLFELLGGYIYYDSIVSKDSIIYIYNDNVIIFQGIEAIYKEESKSSIVLYNKNINKYQMIGFVDEGKIDSIGLNVFQLISNMFLDTTKDYYDELSNLIDMDRWLQYLSIVDYLGLYDVIVNNLGCYFIEDYKLRPLMEDYDLWGGGAIGNNWKNVIYQEKHVQQRGFIFDMIDKVLFKSSKAKDRLLLVWQDLWNTMFLPSRVDSIIDEVHQWVMPEYGFMHQSWGGYPNGGLDSLSQEQMFRGIRDFFELRRDIAPKILADEWMPQDSFSLEDRKNIRIIFDSIPNNVVKVKFNSLDVVSNFSGLYYPKPSIDFEYTTNTEHNIIIKEYPHLTHHFKMNADSELVFTFVLRDTISTSETLKFKSFNCSLSDSAVLINWTTNRLADSILFQLQRSDNNDTFYTIFSNNTFNDSIFNFIDFNTNLGEFSYRVIANYNNQTFVSEECNVLITSKVNDKIRKYVSIYPNPVNNELFVDAKGYLIIFDINGQLVYSNNINKNYISTQSFARGIYFLSVINDGKVYTTKFIKQ